MEATIRIETTIVIIFIKTQNLFNIFLSLYLPHKIKNKIVVLCSNKNED